MSKFTYDQCVFNKNGWAMSLYEWLFKWIIAAINDKLNRISGGAVKTSKAISFLDIYGFEVFENNTFDQLVINYANEKL